MSGGLLLNSAETDTLFRLLISQELMPGESCWQQKNGKDGLPQQSGVAKVWQA